MTEPSARTGRQTATATPVVGHRFVVVALLIAGVLLLPGVLGRLGIAVDPGSRHGVALAELWVALDDIRFGSGVRFWLGVGGTVAMALLLLYPARKALASRRYLGSIAAWFKTHLLIGIFAPIAILYHTNFSTGGLNANVALWTMLAVALSGIVGHFVYARASAAFYGDKQAARQHLDAALALITSLGGAHGQRDQLATRLEVFDAEQVMPHNGIGAAMVARRAVRAAKRTLIQDAIAVIDQAAHEMRLATVLHQATRLEVANLLHGYFAYAKRAAARSVREQLWARWRLFHLPLFLVMCGAIALHVIAVWDMDRPADRPGPATTAPGSTPPIPPALKPVAAQPAPKTVDNQSRDVAAATAIQQVRRASVPINGTPAAATQKVATPPPAPAARPQSVTRPVPVAAASSAPPPPPAVAEVPSPPRAADKPEPGKQLYEELQKRMASEPLRGSEPRMALGRTRSLTEQIEAFKAKMRTREFKHSDAETGFVLTGKHTRADCTDCHNAPLKEVRSEAPRQCVACHKKDDVHKGRRPACVDCHTTSSFRDRSKRRN